jgi:hypothetical protein
MIFQEEKARRHLTNQEAALYNILSAALSKRGGMESDDLLCSRNARSQTPLVGRAQSKINQPPSLERYRASLEGM